MLCALLRILEFLVKRTDTRDAHFRILLKFKFEAHRHLFKLLSFECKRIPDCWFTVQSLEDVSLFENLCIIFFQFWNAVVESNDFSR